MGESAVKKSTKGEKMRWRWVFGAFVTIVLAIALASRTPPKIPLKYGDASKTCECSQDRHRHSGIVEDCCCNYETVDHLNGEVLHPLLQELIKTPFFRYFKVRLWCDCPFWPDDGMCLLRDCSVCECPESEFPDAFKPNHRTLPSDDLKCQEGNPQSAVDRTLDSKVFRGWTETDNPWTYDDETDNSEMTYVNLQLNPERYTGYSGSPARRIWDAVYSENCPKYPAEELCQEEKILYKLISGLHSSISVHIASDYLLDEATSLATEYLEQAEYDTGNPTDDLKTQSLMKQLLYNPKLQAACPLPFDEAKLWKGQRGPELKQKIQSQFKNISAVMDCVGCEKCRLWGKLQVSGLGTALKILFSVNGEENLVQTLQMQRNEVISLMNLLNRLSESVKFVHEMGPAAERLVKGKIHSPSRLNSLVQRILASIVKT
ncbi:endoplasmic reticulum oxidoreductin-1-like isoform X2 [Hibiscus syriacus]|uniref:endoplasmic reticulum oxidoreductin-1-like isoform X2 n=1 Tax=Hibiscus syriacus TaxID=106335 RepID=UPI001924A63A|nr:endoplasmic reticulum oxidoreductin-1-like isoform X2 [Hibiscus syriacus]